MKKVLLIGGSGLLGVELKTVLAERGCVVAAPRRRELDITDTKTIAPWLDQSPDLIINAAAEIDVERIEKDPARAYAVNAEGAGAIARILKERAQDVPYLYLSTQYVFGDVKEAYREDDAPCPVNKYGETKVRGEQLVSEAPRYYIVRTSWLYGMERKTFIDDVVQTFREGRQYRAIDQRGNPTYALHLAHALADFFVDTEMENGIYHLTNAALSDRGVSRFEIATEIAAILEVSLTRIEHASAETVFLAKRPAHAVLLSTKTHQLPSWKAALREYIQRRYF